MKEIQAKCLLGNGVCPEECPNYELALKVTQELGDKFTPHLARQLLFFADSLKV